MSLKTLIINDKALKRFKYVYLPAVAVIFAALIILSFMTQKPEADYANLNMTFAGKIPIVYHPYYNISFGGLEEFHPFDSKKYGRVYKKLLSSSPLTDDQVIKAGKPIHELLLLAHSQRYLNSLKSSWTLARITELGFLRFFPSQLSRNIVLEPMLYQTGGSLLAANATLEHGWAINLGGGFHHASYDNGEGFCPLADISLIVKYLRREKLIDKVMIIDLDAHQGNGHGVDFIGDDNTYILDIYNKEIYPNDLKAKEGIDLNVEMPAFVSDKYYLPKLQEALNTAFTDFKPDLVIYVAGTGLLKGDPLGAMDITKAGIIKRDEAVFKKGRDTETPIVMLLSGGYQKSNADVIAESILNLDNRFNLF